MPQGRDDKPQDTGNRRATGARKFPLEPDRPRSGTEIDQDAAKNKPKKPYGLTQPANETSEDTSQSDNVDQGPDR